ncbi:hypothetical protein CLV67_1351 [Actinoplanes italicus]|uniref:Uncharacterized protein n=1 Tax=Actinoplanes italicus TaxID=113567 RepID=A0A2T0JQ32_9ACTN|nr:hypothetical protein CLV67_1351 [Actinoplanes italicus]
MSLSSQSSQGGGDFLEAGFDVAGVASTEVVYDRDFPG